MRIRRYHDNRCRMRWSVEADLDISGSPETQIRKMVTADCGEEKWVYSWQGQSGHDRHNTDPSERRMEEWAPEMAEEIRSGWNENQQG